MLADPRNRSYTYLWNRLFSAIPQLNTSTASYCIPYWMCLSTGFQSIDKQQKICWTDHLIVKFFNNHERKLLSQSFIFVAFTIEKQVDKIEVYLWVRMTDKLIHKNHQSFITLTLTTLFAIVELWRNRWNSLLSANKQENTSLSRSFDIC